MELTLDFSYAMAVKAKVKSKVPVSAQHLAMQSTRIAEHFQDSLVDKNARRLLTNIYEGVSGYFPDLSFAMPRASVNSDKKMFCNSGASVWLSIGLILVSSTSPSLSLPLHN